jgi:hypothetical protein
MKVFRESVQVSSGPFTHIGYVAANVMQSKVALLVTGSVFLIAGIAVCLRGARVLSRREPVSGDRTGRKFGLPLLVLVITGLAFLSAWFYFRTETLKSSIFSTRMNALMILKEYRRARESGREDLKEPADLRRSDPDLGRYFLDAWGNTFRFARKDRDGKEAWEISSSGPDGIPDTKDDLVFLAKTQGGEHPEYDLDLLPTMPEPAGR